MFTSLLSKFYVNLNQVTCVSSLYLSVDAYVYKLPVHPPSAFRHPLLLDTFSNSVVLNVPTLLNFRMMLLRKIGRFKISRAVLDVVFPETLLSINPTTGFLGMLVLRCETNNFFRNVAKL